MAATGWSVIARSITSGAINWSIESQGAMKKIAAPMGVCRLPCSMTKPPISAEAKSADQQSCAHPIPPVSLLE